MNSEDQELKSGHEEHLKENMFKMIPQIRKQGKREDSKRVTELLESVYEVKISPVLNLILLSY